MSIFIPSGKEVFKHMGLKFPSVGVRSLKTAVFKCNIYKIKTVNYLTITDGTQVSKDEV